MRPREDSCTGSQDAPGHRDRAAPTSTCDNTSTNGRSQSGNYHMIPAINHRGNRNTASQDNQNQPAMISAPQIISNTAKEGFGNNRDSSKFGKNSSVVSGKMSGVERVGGHGQSNSQGPVSKSNGANDSSSYKQNNQINLVNFKGANGTSNSHTSNSLNMKSLNDSKGKCATTTSHHRNIVLNQPISHISHISSSSQVPPMIDTSGPGASAQNGTAIHTLESTLNANDKQAQASDSSALQKLTHRTSGYRYSNCTMAAAA